MMRIALVLALAVVCAAQANSCGGCGETCSTVIPHGHGGCGCGHDGWGYGHGDGGYGLGGYGGWGYGHGCGCGCCQPCCRSYVRPAVTTCCRNDDWSHGGWGYGHGDGGYGHGHGGWGYGQGHGCGCCRPVCCRSYVRPAVTTCCKN